MRGVIIVCLVCLWGGAPLADVPRIQQTLGGWTRACGALSCVYARDGLTVWQDGQGFLHLSLQPAPPDQAELALRRGDRALWLRVGEDVAHGPLVQDWLRSASSLDVIQSGVVLARYDLAGLALLLETDPAQDLPPALHRFGVAQDRAHTSDRIVPSRKPQSIFSQRAQGYDPPPLTGPVDPAIKP